jgi:formamidopyrimidine-DNA glycosylase
VSRKEYAALSKGIKKVLNASIKAGGTTLRDFAREDGEPGYFSQRLRVYGRDGQRCYRCGGTIVAKATGQRMTYWCRNCQL